MEAQSKLLKLLETATHTSATDYERLSALNAFRRITDKAGGLTAFFSARSNDTLAKDLELAKDALRLALIENAQLKAERDDVRGGAQSNYKKSDSDPKDHLQLDLMIYNVLLKDWQELHRIHERIKMEGYEGDSATTKRHLDRLCLSGKAVRREAGNHNDLKGGKRWQAQAWRVKATRWFKP